MGSTIRMTKENGQTIAWADYDAWGVPLSPQGHDMNTAWIDNAVGFTSYTYDKVLDLYFAQARFYDANTRRFISVDPIKDGLNWYAYCGNNPVVFVDPLGLALLRDYVEDNNGTITWDGKTQTVTATVNGLTRTFTAGTHGIFVTENNRMVVSDDILDVAFSKGSQQIVDNKYNIVNSANNFDVDAKIVAGVIYTEQRYNVNRVDSATDWVGIYRIPFLDTSVGIGQVKISAVKFLEDNGYVPKITETISMGGGYALTPHQQRYVRLAIDSNNIEYVAAYLKYFQDTWENAYPNIKNNAGVLGTLYNNGPYDSSGKLRTPHANPQPSPGFGSCVQQHYNAMGYLLSL